MGLSVAAGLLAALAFGGSASAATVSCSGSAIATDKVPGDKTALEYDFACNEEIKAYSIVSNRQLSFFSTEVLVYSSETDQPAGLLLGCEGPLPGAGFSCSYRSSGGVVPANFRVRGELAPQGDPCAAPSSKKGKPKKAKKPPWGLNLVVAGIQQVTNPNTGAVTSFTTTSEPFPLAMPPCAKPKK